ATLFDLLARYEPALSLNIYCPAQLFHRHDPDDRRQRTSLDSLSTPGNHDGHNPGVGHSHSGGRGKILGLHRTVHGVNGNGPRPALGHVGDVVGVRTAAQTGVAAPDLLECLALLLFAKPLAARRSIRVLRSASVPPVPTPRRWR